MISWQARNVVNIIDRAQGTMPDYDVQALKHELQQLIYGLGGTRQVDSFGGLEAALGYMFLLCLASGRLGE